MLENFRIAKFLMQERQGIMIMKFYGRETERKKLNSMFQTEGQMICFDLWKKKDWKK